MSNEATACELRCLNGGMCRWVSTAATDVQTRMVRGESVQECLCQPGYSGTGCEVHVGMCPDLYNADECACTLASQISAMAAESYCSTSPQRTDYCFPSDDQATQQQATNVSTSLQNLVFCVNGGMCTGTVLGSTDPPSNVFAQDADDCLCPVGFAGPHCEFLKMYGDMLNSSITDGKSDATVNSSTTTTIDDAFEGALIQDDAVPQNSNGKGGPSNATVAAQSQPDRTAAWSILACLCGVALVTLSLVVYLKCSRRQRREARATPSITGPSTRRMESRVTWLDSLRQRTRQRKASKTGVQKSHNASVENSNTKAHPSLSEDAISTSTERRIKTWWRSLRSRLHPPSSSMPESITSTAEQELEAVARTNDLTERAESSRGSSNECNSSPPVLDDGDIDDEVLFDDDEILIGTFETHAIYHQDNVAERGIVATNGRGFEGDYWLEQPIASRARVSSAFSSFPSVTVAASPQIDESDIGTLHDPTSLPSASSSSYCSSDSSLSIEYDPIKGYVAPRDSGLLSPNSLYTSASEQVPASLAGIGLPNAASFSDYSSFPESVTDGSSIFSPDAESTVSDDGSSSGITMDWSERRYFTKQANMLVDGELEVNPLP